MALKVKDRSYEHTLDCDNFIQMVEIFVQVLSSSFKIVLIYALSPLILRTKAKSFVWIVTRLAWSTAKLASSNKETIYASAASCKANTAEAWNLSPVYVVTVSEKKSIQWCGLTIWSCAISRTSRWKGRRRMRRSVDFW
jgi:hypothetical protein